MVDLPEKFVNRMRRELGDEAEDFFASYDAPAYKGIRVNTLKISAEDFISLSPFSLRKIDWEKNGFYVEDEKPGKTVYHAAGAYYVQEPSAMCAAPLLEVKPGERVLDLCSAPGGKGTQLAQEMHGEGIIVLNEINFSRAKILMQNVERLGVQNAVVTCASPSKLSKNFRGYFDKILVDAPCSGEGMFKKEPNAIPEWSEENVTACAVRQREILLCAAEMLKSGGRLVYSTCTFSREEDEQTIEDFLKKRRDFTLIKQEKLYPHRVEGEGHFAALMEKSSGNESEEVHLPETAVCVKDKKAYGLYKQFEKEYLKVSFGNILQSGEYLYSLPLKMPETGVQIVRAGVQLCEIKGDRIEPCHALAMCLKQDLAKCVAVDETTAVKYLSGFTFAVDEREKGWRVVTYNGLPLGWCKCVNGTAKNHLPKGLRV